MMTKRRSVLLTFLLLLALLVIAPASTVSAGISGPIGNVNSLKCLEIPSYLTWNGAPVDQAPCKGTVNQLWRSVYVDSTWFNLVNQNSGKCLDVTNLATANGSPVQQWQCPGGGGRNQQWRLAPVSGHPGWFNIIGRASGKCLDVVNRSTLTGARLQIWDCPYGGGKNQQWYLLNN